MSGWDSYARVAALLLLIIQSIGIRFASGQGILLSFVILFLSANGLTRFSSKDILYMLAPIALFSFSKIVNPHFDTSALIFQSLLVVCAYVVLKNYRSAEQLTDDFYIVLQLIAYHAIIGYLLFMLSPDSFQNSNFSGMPYRTLYNLFFIAYGSEGDGFRNCGVCWEPGLLQLVLNLLLFLSIQRKAHFFQLLIIALAIVSTLSTAGFIIIGLNVLYFLIQNRNTKNGWIFIVGTLSLLFFFSAFFLSNITDKLGETNTSGVIRSRDFRIGIELIKEKPVIGHGKFTSRYIVSQGFSDEIEAELFTKEFLELNGDMPGGFTNGFLALFAWFGIPFGIVALIMLFNNNVIKAKFYERVIFMLIIIFTLVSEPVTDTTLFFLLVFSAVAIKREDQKKAALQEAGNSVQLDVS